MRGSGKMSEPWFSNEGPRTQKRAQCPESGVKSFIELTETSHASTCTQEALFSVPQKGNGCYWTELLGKGTVGQQCVEE